MVLSANKGRLNVIVDADINEIMDDGRKKLLYLVNAELMQDRPLL